MEPNKRPEKNPDETHEEVETLMDWAEAEPDTAHETYHLAEDEEPCESDIEDDRVGLPGSTSDDDYNELAYTADEEMGS